MNKIGTKLFLSAGAIFSINLENNLSYVKKTVENTYAKALALNPEMDSFISAQRKKYFHTVFDALKSDLVLDQPFADAKIKTITLVAIDTLYKDLLKVLGHSMLELGPDQQNLYTEIQNQITDIESKPTQTMQKYDLSKDQYLQCLYTIMKSSEVKNRWLFLHKFPLKEIIHFSSNTPENLILNIHDLRKLFGEKFLEKAATESMITSWSLAWISPKNSFDDLLKVRLSLSKGCCYGNSILFLSLYLEEIERGLLPIEAVKKTSIQFSKAPPLRAEKAQFLNYFPSNRLKKALKIEAVEGLIWETFNQAHLSDPEKFDSVIQQLPPGVYLTILSSGIDDHACALIKTDHSRHFIYDPNYGVLAVEDKDLGNKWRAVNALYKIDQNTLKKLGITDNTFIDGIDGYDEVSFFKMKRKI